MAFRIGHPRCVSGHNTRVSGKRLASLSDCRQRVKGIRKCLRRSMFAASFLFFANPRGTIAERHKAARACPGPQTWGQGW